ncbi:hypothetical protein EST38_g7512 [Candolleomyces aberdarensis]|uniref:Dienelactone hydrolase domain-containing protein n=1 Tax=Candolleomyces aberdarensis TaxID=2316362 RepID=A0A4Q2DGS0_9AGAR|nr:hypothetical protein EST38_g7512 [Candolleomyces aberdarensis]
MLLSSHATFGLISILSWISSAFAALSSPSLAGALSKNCTQGWRHSGSPKGRNVTIAGVPTYLVEPIRHSGTKKVIFFYADAFGTFFINNQLLQDYFASQGYYVLGLDYFFGDPIGLHLDKDLQPIDPNFNLTAWVEKSRRQAAQAVPIWNEAVRKRYGQNAKYNAVGYCFGALYSVGIGATDDVVATAFAHPAELTEAHFTSLRKPILLSCAETDEAFPTADRNQAVDLLTQNNKTYHYQVFSGTAHGFATRGDPNDPNAVWAMKESAKSVVGWFDRFST